MNMREAFRETVEMALLRRMPMRPGSELGLHHLLSMQVRITPEFSEAKLGRWLGWAQCAVVAAGCATLEEMKDLNRRHGKD